MKKLFLKITYLMIAITGVLFLGMLFAWMRSMGPDVMDVLRALAAVVVFVMLALNLRQN